MKIDYDVGDVVVCVNQNTSKHPRVIGVNRGITKIGKTYRVEEFRVGRISGEIFVRLRGYEHGSLGCLATMFRKLPKADAGFTSLIRRKTVPKQVPENA